MRSTFAFPRLDRLRRIPGLETATTAELITLASLTDECRLFAGRVISHLGCVPHQVLLLASGAAQVATCAEPLPRLVGPGAMVGLRPVLLGPDHSEHVVVASDIEVLVIPLESLDRFLALPSIRPLAARCTAQPAARGFGLRTSPPAPAWGPQRGELGGTGR